MKIISTKKYSLLEIMNTIKRNQSQKSDVEKTVRDIIQNVRRNKDRALFSLSEKFDGVKLKTFQISKEEILEAYKQESKEVVMALKAAKSNIEKFHKSNIIKKENPIITTEGVKVWREFRPIEKVGLYIPGGKASYPSTVLMLGVPAKIAGCKEIVLCVPPGKDGKVPSVVLVAADICGISKIFKVGGAQAIAAMAYGTESIPKVYKIFGPGNQYVTTAKMLVYGEVDIDMPAGPSEVLVFADEQANPSWVAADLLSQLEHGEDSQAILVTLSQTIAERVLVEVKKQAKNLGRKEIIKESLQKSFIVIMENDDQACELINEYAPEHLEIISKSENKILQKINNSALSVEAFGKKMQIQRVTKDGINKLRKTVEVLATREGLDAHKNAIDIRFKKII